MAANTAGCQAQHSWMSGQTQLDVRSNIAGCQVAPFVLMRGSLVFCCHEASQSCFLLGRILITKNILMGIMDVWSRT